MTETRIQSITLLILGVLFAYFVFAGNGSIREARRITKTLDKQVDSLKILARNYESIQMRYVAIYNELTNTRDKVDKLRNKLENISSSNINNVALMKDELGKLIAAYDTLNYRIDPIVIDENLRFEP